MLEILMAPSNAVCDAVGLTDEHERGMLRMLVNMMLSSAIAVVIFVLAFAVILGYLVRAFREET